MKFQDIKTGCYVISKAKTLLYDFHESDANNNPTNILNCYNEEGDLVKISIDEVDEVLNAEDNERVYNTIRVEIFRILNASKTYFSDVDFSAFSIIQGIHNKYNSFLRQIYTNFSRDNSANVPFPLNENEELLYLLYTMSYRLYRNLLAIKRILPENYIESEFRKNQFTVGVILRSNLCDYVEFCKLRTFKDVRKMNLDSFLFMQKEFTNNLTYLNSLPNSINEKTDLIKSVEKEKKLVDEVVININKSTVSNKIFLEHYENIHQASSVLKSYQTRAQNLYLYYSKYDHYSLFESSMYNEDPKSLVNKLSEALNVLIPLYLDGIKIIIREDIEKEQKEID